ncbi:MAG TPA: dipeptidyl carboxypeptidase II, partial [Opitutaceae bacterium]|nr:dipeptidyl carboxypeptidase II [Opitutaceae bacterium]
MVFAEGIVSPLSAQADNANPLLTESALQFQYPAFDKIKEDDFPPAFEQGMAGSLKEVEAIATNPEKPTLENTIVALERSGRLLARVERIFSNLVGADTNPALDKIESQMAPKLSSHADAIRLNGTLFTRIQTLYDNRDQLGLDPESKRLLERYYSDFTRAGAKLSEAEKTKLKTINAEQAKLQTAFSQHVQKEINASAVVVDNRADLAGLSDNEIAATVVAAKASKQEGKYVIRLLNTTGQPSLASLENRALRERI